MTSKFPKLTEQLEQLLWEFEKKIDEVIKSEKIEDVELAVQITADDFVHRSNASKVAYSLREILSSCYTRGKIDSSKITEEHISVAQSLVKLGRYQKTAIEVLSQALLSSNKNENGVAIRKIATEALAECAMELISDYDNDEDLLSTPYPRCNEDGRCEYMRNGIVMTRGNCVMSQDCIGRRKSL